jgi:hypothetical protein
LVTVIISSLAIRRFTCGKDTSAAQIFIGIQIQSGIRKGLEEVVTDWRTFWKKYERNMRKKMRVVLRHFGTKRRKFVAMNPFSTRKVRITGKFTCWIAQVDWYLMRKRTPVIVMSLSLCETVRRMRIALGRIVTEFGLIKERYRFENK